MPRGDHWKPWQDRLSAGYIEDERGCHIWQRACNNKGYGVIYFDGRLHLAHRASWLATHGTWPNPALVIDHICNVRACVNPAHLRELTNGQNIMRAYPRGDEKTESRRARQRAASQRYRARRRGESIAVV